MVGVVSSILSGGNFIFADFETPRCQFCTKLPEMSDEYVSLEEFCFCVFCEKTQVIIIIYVRTYL